MWRKVKTAITNKKALLVDLSVILLLGTLSITWFKGGNLISGGDYDWILDWRRFFRQCFSVWDKTVSFGLYRPTAVFIPFAAPGALFESVGLSPSLIEKLYFFLWFTGSGLSMYFLTAVFGMRRLGRLSSSIFYMLNPFSLVIVWRVSHGHLQTPYAFAPLFLGLFIWGYLKGKGFKFVVLANLILLFLNGSSYNNPRNLLMQLAPVFFFFLASIIFERNQRLGILKYSVLFFAVFFLFNLFSFFPWIYNLQGLVEGSHASVLMSDIEELKLTSVGLSKAIRMLGYWSLYSGYKGGPYYPYWQFYTRLLPNALSWFIPLLVFLGLWEKNFRRKTNLFFVLAVIFLGLWGMKGPLPPFGQLTSWFYQKVPYALTAARFSFWLYGLPTYLIFSLLLGSGFLTIYDLFFKKIKNLLWPLLGMILFLLCGVLVYPFWTGEVIKPSGEVIPGERFKIPDYWRETETFLDRQPEFFRVLPLPMSKTYNSAFYWGEGYSGADLTHWLTKKPYLSSNTGLSFAVPEIVGNIIEKENRFGDAEKLLGMLSVKYLLLRNDTRWDLMRGHNWWFTHDQANIGSFLQNQKGIVLEKETGALKFYKVKEGLLLPELYLPSKLVMVDGNVQAAEDIAGFLKPEEKEAVFFADQNKEEIFPQEVLSQYFIWQEPKSSNGSAKEVLYEIKTGIEGNYELYWRDDDLFTYYQKADNVTLQIDDNPASVVKLENFGHNLFKLGTFSLTKGNHLLKILSPPAANLLTDSSFIAHYRASDSYFVSFSVKHLEGSGLTAALWLNDERINTPIWNPKVNQFGSADPLTRFSTVKLPPVDDWKDYNFSLSPQPGIKIAGLAFINEEEAKNLFDKVKVTRIFNNPVVLRFVPQTSSLSQPAVSYQRVNDTRYKVKIEGATSPYWLVFSYAFDPGWEISLEGRHFLVNGFANAWLIDELGNYEFELSYSPQKIFVFFLILSFGGIAVSLLAVVTKYLWSRRKT